MIEPNSYDAHLRRIVISPPATMPARVAPAVPVREAAQAPIPRYAIEPSGDASEIKYLKSRIERLEIMINGATIGLTTVCNGDGSVTNTATLTWGS